MSVMCSALKSYWNQDLFSPQECKEYVKFIDNLPLELTPPPKKDEATRVNRRYTRHLSYVMLTRTKNRPLLNNVARLLAETPLPPFPSPSVVSVPFFRTPEASRCIGRRVASTPTLVQLKYSNIQIYERSIFRVRSPRLVCTFRVSLLTSTPTFDRPHYDDSVKDALTGDTSEWTLLIYLTGEEDGVQGGEVRRFYGSSRSMLTS
jgi:hypothetical protein